MTLKNSLLLAWRKLGHLTRLSLELGMLLVIAGGILLLALRYWILPDIERYHDRITRDLSAALGQPLTIGKIEADWNGLRPRLLLSDVQVLDKEGHVALRLPRLENTIAWTSLPTLELRFDTLLIDSPDLAVQRDAQGQWSVAGFALNTRSPGRPGSADWLLHQASLAIRHGRITWQDELRGAPVLVLQQVDLSIENRLGGHRFALRASPPEQLASRLDVRGNLVGGSFADMSQWRGTLFTQLDYADVLAWKRWVSLPEEFKRGKGALRVWLDVEGGQVAGVDADVVLAGVQARLAEDQPQLDLRELRGRVGWHALDRGFDIETKRLALQMRDGFKLKPTDFYLRLAGERNKSDASGEIRFNALDLGDLGVLAAYLPLPDDMKQQLTAADPRGSVSGAQASWRLRADGSLRYDVKGRFDRLSLRRVENRPGFSNLSGQVEGDDSSGTLVLNSRKFGLEAPQLFAEPLAFDTFTASLGWQRGSLGLEIKLSDVEVANADLAGTIYGSYQMGRDGPGSIDATVDMKRVAVKRTARYTPLPAVNKGTHDWLQAALQGGQADMFRVRLRGDLRNFPFVGSQNGIFRLEARAKGVTMEFAKGWPRLEEAQTHLLILGNKLDIDAPSATSAGAHLQNIQVGIPDLLASQLSLQVRGEAADATQHCLDYISKSPVNGYLDGFTEGVKARGQGRLNLQLDIPLKGGMQTKVRGDYRFVNNDIDFGDNVPLLRNVNGLLLFTESSLHAGDINAQVLGGPAQLTVSSEKGGLVTRAQGRLDLENLNRLQPRPLLGRVHGATDWSAEIRVHDRLVDVVVDTDLQGIASTLPVPLDKRPSDRIPVHFAQKNLSPREGTLDLRYGSLLNASLTREREQDGTWALRRGRISLGSAAAVAPASREGIWIAGQLPELSIEGWAGLGLGSERAALLPNIASINVMVDKVTGYGSTVKALDIRGSARNGLLSVRLASRELNGDLIWQPQGNGKLLGRFRSVMLGEGPPAAPQPVAPPREGRPDNTSFPAVDIAVDRLSYKGRQLGRLELEMSESNGDVQLDRLQLTNPDGEVNMTAKWQAVPEQTQVNVRVDIADAGRILSRSGYPDSLKGGKGTLESNLYWAGAPDSFSYAKLNGTLHLNVGKGRFLKLDPGVGKLLGVLSLQSIPKRITLDFTDVFSEGFQFDSITGTAQVVNGLLLTSDMKLNGAAANVTMAGQVDLNRETQNLKVRVLPALGDNVSLLSFAAGPAVGVGVLLANKLLRNPLDKLVSFEYNVSGSWADPKVEKVGVAQVPQNGAGK